MSLHAFDLLQHVTERRGLASMNYRSRAARGPATPCASASAASDTAPCGARDRRRLDTEKRVCAQRVVAAILAGEMGAV